MVLSEITLKLGFVCGHSSLGTELNQIIFRKLAETLPSMHCRAELNFNRCWKLRRHDLLS